MKQRSSRFSPRRPGLSARAFRGLGAGAVWITIVAAAWSCSGGAAVTPEGACPAGAIVSAPGAAASTPHPRTLGWTRRGAVRGAEEEVHARFAGVLRVRRQDIPIERKLPGEAIPRARGMFLRVMAVAPGALDLDNTGNRGSGPSARAS